MPRPYKWSVLLDDLYHMKVESDKGVTEKPLLALFIEKIKEQQLSLVLEKKPGNLEVLFGYCVACLLVVRQKQLKIEKEHGFEKASQMDPELAAALNFMFDTLEVLGQQEASGKK